ncbi:single-stranded-DNA-specific exonuclease C-terminal domain-containing protein [Latilactobacillus graminis]|nr:single-stranded-DNA-specific exonuclease C-terminal domain-containing protein [Latilactobacillus graminis]
MAVGLTLPTDQLGALQAAMNAYANEHQIDLTTKLTMAIDLQLGLSDVTPEVYQAVSQLAPYGTDNPEPLIEINVPTVANLKQIGADQKHLKFTAVDQDVQLAVLAFNRGALYDDLQTVEQLKLVGQLSENTWRGQTTLQLMLKDLQTSGRVLIDQRSNRLTQQSFVARGTYVFFDEKNLAQLHNYVPTGCQAILATDVDQQTALIVVDEPADLTEFETFYRQQQADKISFIFYSKHSAYLEGIPDKQQFAQCLIYLRQHAYIEKKRLDELAIYLKIKLPLLIFMLQVFFDLGFVKIDRGLISAVKQPEKHPLESAASYQQRLAKIEMEKQLVYSTFAEMKDWLVGLNQ